jgi:hypothetical protein
MNCNSLAIPVCTPHCCSVSSFPFPSFLFRPLFPLLPFSPTPTDGIKCDAFDWTLLDSAEHAGGLARSVVDPHGFTWDMGGHVIFSHYEYFTKLLDGLIGEWNSREREAWVWMRQRFVPYPLQNNVW